VSLKGSQLTGDLKSEDSGRGGSDADAALTRLEATVLTACAKSGEWPAQIAAGLYAGVGFAMENPALVEVVLVDDSGQPGAYERLLERLVEMIRLKAPAAKRLPGSTDEALVASILGLVGDHVRIGRLDRLAELRADLVLLTLLPYLGFADAQRWANLTAPS
jgi:hypothetical protein